MYRGNITGQSGLKKTIPAWFRSSINAIYRTGLLSRIFRPWTMWQRHQDMHVRGAGLIGAAAGYGMYLAGVQLAQEPR